MQSLKDNATLRWGSNMFRRGVFPGVVAGVVAGLAPGILLILVLTGDLYHIEGSEVLGFIVMSIAAGALLGAAIGGSIALCAGILRRWLTALGALRP